MPENEIKKIKLEIADASTDESLVAKIYRLAKARDEEALTKMVKEGICLGQFQGEFNAIMLLASEGDSDSVNFLIDNFKGSRNHAVEGYARGGYVEQVNQLIGRGADRDFTVCGYARGGYVEQVNQLIDQGASRHFAVWGYAQGGYVEQVNQLIDQGADRNCAVSGYAQGGYVEQVNQLIGQGADRDEAVEGYARGGYVEQVNQQIGQGANRNCAVSGYAQGGYVEQVNQLLGQGADRDCAVSRYAQGGYVEQVNQLIGQGASRHFAVRAYARGGYVEQVNQLIGQGASRDCAVYGYVQGGHVEQQIEQNANVLRLMAYTDDEALRKLLAEKVNKSHQSLDVGLLQIKATRLNKIMREYPLNFKQAQSLTIKGARNWILESPQVMRDKKFPAVIPTEIYFHIMSFVLGLSTQDTIKVFNVVHSYLYLTSVEEHSQKLRFGLFSPEEVVEENKKAGDRYIKRITF